MGGIPRGENLPVTAMWRFREDIRTFLQEDTAEVNLMVARIQMLVDRVTKEESETVTQEEVAIKSRSVI